MLKTLIVVIAWLSWFIGATAVSADFPSAQQNLPTGTHPATERLAELTVPHGTKGLDAQSVQSTDELIRLTTLLTAVNRFKQVSLANYERALLMFATEDAVAKFRSFNQNIWVDTSPIMGWSYFMSSSVHVVGDAKRQQPLVAFYNPWSDVFLITEWRLDGDIPRMVDAEMLMGDWLRPRSNLDFVPYWLRTNTFKPAALGNSVAQSIAIFEELFQNTGSSSWRRKVPVLENNQLLAEVNYPAIALMLLNNLQKINEFRVLKKGSNPRLAACRRLTVDLINSGDKGQLEGIRKSVDETLPETWNVLKSIDPKWFRTLEVVALLCGKDGCLVFLSPVFDVTGSLSLFFKGKKADLILKRIDVVDYSAFYQALKGKGEAPRKELSL